MLVLPGSSGCRCPVRAVGELGGSTAFGLGGACCMVLLPMG
jgi:hypothetical protein